MVGGEEPDPRVHRDDDSKWRGAVKLLLGSTGLAIIAVTRDMLLEGLLNLVPLRVAMVIGILAAVAVVIYLVLKVIPPATQGQPPGRLREGLRLAVTGLMVIAVFLVSALFVHLASVPAISWARERAHDPCDRRLELRVLTTPELVSAVRAQAGLFADRQAKLAGCRPVRLTVSAVSSVPDLESAFQHRWAATPGTPVLGPQPDVWIPASTETVRHLQDNGVSNLRQIGRVGTSPLVMAVPDGNAAVIGPQTGQTLSELVSAARDEGLTAIRANPETSEVGLVATVSLYQGHSGDGDKSRSRRRESERWMAGITLPARDSIDLMCAVRRAQSGGGETPKIAALIPEHVLHAYNSGAPLGTGCPRWEVPRAALSAFYPKGVRTFDHPFVQVGWAGQVSWERTSMIRKFHDRLERELGASGLRDVDGAVAAARIAGQSDLEFPPADPRPDPRLDRTLRQFRQARPAVAVRLVVDISGSMGAGIPTQGSRLDRARRLLHSALKLLASEQSNDHVGLVSFPAWPAGPDLSHSELKRLGPTRGRDLELLNKKIDSLVTAAGTSSPLYATINKSIGFPRDTTRIPTVVVLTDGGDKVSKGPPGGDRAGLSGEKASDAWLGTLVEALKATGGTDRPHLVFLTIGAPEWCQGPQVRSLGEHTQVDCYDATTDDADVLLSGAIGQIRTGAR